MDYPRLPLPPVVLDPCADERGSGALGYLLVQQFAYQFDQVVQVIFISLVCALQGLDVSCPIRLGPEHFREDGVAR